MLLVLYLKGKCGIKGFQRAFLFNEWHDMLHIIQRYVTCEGIFDTVYRYHMIFLQHVTGANKLNLPFYLLKSLEKKATRARNHPSSSSSNMFHHGLIKLLIFTQKLGKVERSWSHFIFWGGFKVNFKDA